MREVQVAFTAVGGKSLGLYFALAGTPVADAVAFAAATPLMDGPTTVRHLGKPGVFWVFAGFGMDAVRFPFAVKVETGSRWVHVAWERSAAKELFAVVSATVIGYARMGANGWGVEDGLDK